MLVSKEKLLELRDLITQLDGHDGLEVLEEPIELDRNPKTEAGEWEISVGGGKTCYKYRDGVVIGVGPDQKWPEELNNDPNQA